MDFQKAGNWSWLENALNIINSLDSKSRISFINSEFFECGPLVPIRALFDIKAKDKIEGLQRTLYFDILNSADEHVYGSSIYLSKFLKTEELENTGKMCVRKPFSEYLKTVTGMTRNKKTKNILSNFEDLLSADGRIVLKYGKRKNPTMEIREGFKILATLDPVFSKIVGQSKISMDYCYVICIEGSISSVSEIHGLLEKFSQKKFPCMLICQNFSEEIANTLAVNWLKEKLLIVPLRYGNSLSNINLLSDLAATTGTLPISKNLGDSIASACLDEERYGNLENINIYEQYCLATPGINASHHIDNLLKRLSKESHEDKIEIMSERITNLSSNVLEITVYEKDVSVYEELDACIKILNEFIKHGAVNYCGTIMPYSIYSNCVERSRDLKNRVSSIGGFLYQQ